MSLRLLGKETSREVDLEDELSPIESDDSDMDALLASVRRKKPRFLKQPTSELSSEGTERTPLLTGKTSLRPRQRSRSISVSPTGVEKYTEPGRTACNSEFYTPKRQPLKQVGQPRSGKSNIQHYASMSASASTSSLQNHLPSPPSITDPDDLMSPSPSSYDCDRTKLPETISGYESSSEEENQDHEIGRADKQNDPEKQGELSKVLKDMTSVLNKLVKRVENNSNEIHALKSTLKSSSTPSSSNESSSGSGKRKIPAIVQSETRRVYTMFLDGGENFEGFVIRPGVTWKSDENVAAVTVLTKEVKSLNPTFQAGDIRDAAYTYYKSLSQQESAERRGLTKTRNKTRRSRERISRKLQERTIVLKRSSLPPLEKEKWAKVLIPEMISSEDDNDDEDEDVFVIRPLPWRSTAVDNFFKSLDAHSKGQKTKQAVRQMKSRVLGASSSRPKPLDKTIPKWAFV